MRRRTRRERFASGAVTLVELMMALTMAGVLIVTTTALVASSQTFLTRGSQKVSNQTDLSYAMLRLSEFVWQADRLTVQNGGAQLVIALWQDGSATWSRTVLAESGALKLRQAGLPDEIVIPANASGLAFSYGAGQQSIVNVKLTVGSGNEAARGQTNFALRLQAQ